jgi:hypothetical protein
VGVPGFLGEEKEKKAGKKGPRTSEEKVLVLWILFMI